jgi:mannose-6-phosphate isomerase-like protein (cupin superfamily)
MQFYNAKGISWQENKHTKSIYHLSNPRQFRGLWMLIKDSSKCDYFIAADNTNLCELLHPDKERLDLPYSIAIARLEPGKSSLPHRLKTSSEVYFILKGVGEIHIDSEQAEVHPGQAILISAGSWQYIQNIGADCLRFLCIVNPMWRAVDEEIQF